MLQHPLNRGQEPKAVWRWLRWQIGSRLLSIPVIMPWVDKTVLIIAHGETGLTQNVYCGLHDFAEMAFVLHFLRSDDCFMDIGANSGAYSVLAAGVVGASGVAVEPIPSTFNRLERQLRINRLETKVSALNIGLAQIPGTLYFSTGDDTMNKIVSAEWNGPKTMLPVKTLDEVAGEIPALIKIDVEGHDAEVLLGGPKNLASEILKAIIIEISPRSVVILSGHGFIPCEYDPFSRRLTKTSWEAASASQNTIAVRDFELVQARLDTAPQRRFHGRLF